MKRRYEDMLRVTEEQEDAAEADGEEEHEVERVVDVRTTHDGKEYQVKWVGDDELTWELEANLNCDNLVEQFEEALGRKWRAAAARARRRAAAAAARAAACWSRAATAATRRWSR